MGVGFGVGVDGKSDFAAYEKLHFPGANHLLYAIFSVKCPNM